MSDKGSFVAQRLRAIERALDAYRFAYDWQREAMFNSIRRDVTNLRYIVDRANSRPNESMADLQYNFHAW